jgi:hypothetical protein
MGFPEPFDSSRPSPPLMKFVSMPVITLFFVVLHDVA